MFICILTADYTVKLKRPLKNEDQLSLNAGHSAILLTFIRLPFIIKIFVLSFLSGCLRQVLLY